jgi:hypothetical protein
MLFRSALCTLTRVVPDQVLNVAEEVATKISSTAP